MASGSAGEPGAPVPTSRGPEQVPDMRAIVDNIMDSIITVQSQMATPMEDPETFMNRARSTTDPGPAVRARAYDHEVEIDRTRMMDIEEALRLNASRLDAMEIRLDENESSLSWYSAELTGDRDRIFQISNDLNDLRNSTSSSRATVRSARDRTVVTAVRGFDKLKIYTGASSQWKEWRYKVTTWLAQTSSSFESLMIKLDASEVEPIEPEVGRNMVAGPAEITTEEK